MPYDPVMIQPFRDELTSAGFQELRTAAEVDAALAQPGTALLVVNSVCGCAAGVARPGVVEALRRGVKADRLLSVFAGQELEATARARARFEGYSPSSPNIALMKDGKLAFLLQRHQIQVMDVGQIAAAVERAVAALAGGAAPAAPRALDLPVARG
jgi:putative YphP/YqiW family bacilliredoxin